jgi:hypothetical protein
LPDHDARCGYDCLLGDLRRRHESQPFLRISSQGGAGQDHVIHDEMLSLMGFV